MKRPSGHYALKDLEELAREKTAELSALIGRDLELQWPPRGTRKGVYRDWEFSDWEIDCFLRAYREYSLFELKPRIGPPSARWPNGCPHVGFAGAVMPVNPRTQDVYVHEFLDTGHETNIARLYKQEYFIQSSAAGELAGFYGQPRERLLLEAPLVRDVGMGIRSSGAYAMDLAVFDGPRTPTGSGTPVIGAPIKVSRDDHQELIARFKRCRGLHDSESCGSDHRNCLWIRQNLTVQHLWVRSQNESDLFKVQRAGDGGFDLEQLPDSQIQGVLSRHDWT